MIGFFVGFGINIFDAYVLTMLAARFCIKRWNHKISRFLFVLVFGVVMTGCSIFISSKTVSYVTCLIAMFILTNIFYRKTLSNFLAVIILVGASSISEIIGANAIALLVGEQFSEILGKDDSITIIIAVLSKLLEYIFVYFIINKIRGSLAGSFQLLRVIFLIITAGIMFNTAILYIGFLEYDTISKYFLVYYFVSVIIYFLFLLFMIYKMESIARENEKHALINLENQLHQDHEENIKVMLDQLRILKHDYRFHLQTLRAMLDNHLYESADDYFNEIAQSIEDSARGYIEKHPATSTMLIKMHKQAKKENIAFEMELPSILDLPISDSDLNIILSNVLENAFYAVREVEYKRRWISLELLIHESCSIVIVENTYQEGILREKENLNTSKKDKTNHGFGLKSVRNIMNKYDGILDIETINNIFSVSLSFPKK